MRKSWAASSEKHFESALAKIKTVADHGEASVYSGPFGAKAIALFHADHYYDFSSFLSFLTFLTFHLIGRLNKALQC